MEAFLQQFPHLNIKLEEITSATNNFDEKNFIGHGGFGRVYKGEVSHFKGRSMAAIKRLVVNPRFPQGTTEFLKEITMLSRYRHENLVSLLGFCYEAGEMILVYEYASRGSLNYYLNSTQLTWPQRFSICLDAAKGISYLHDPKEKHQRLIHCDIKSGNILLDAQWRAKVSDLGLAIMGPANEQQSVIVTTAVGTHGYCDPQYEMTHTLTKESDVYSFGVVLIEVLRGTLCYTWTECYTRKKLPDVIFKSPTIQPLDQSALETFSDIAYRCLKISREDRPNMDEVVTQLETALKIQEFSEHTQLFDYEELTKTAEPPLNYSSKGELWKLLSKGVLLNCGKTWFSFNKMGEHCEMISFAECLDSKLESKWSSEYNSRFATGTYHYEKGSVKTRVKAQFLSPAITYTVNLVFKVVPLKLVRRRHYISLKYKFKGETKTSISYLADEREDGWWACELYQFTCDQQTIDLDILFKGFDYKYTSIQVEGIEFWPLEKVEHEDEIQPISDSDTNWEEKLPTNYEDIMKWSVDKVKWTTKEEVYSLMCEGLLINTGVVWFSLDKNGKKCHMLSAKVACVQDQRQLCWLSLPESRFGKAVQLGFSCLKIICTIKPKLVSSETTYASYLVYKLPNDQSGFEALMVVDEKYSSGPDCWYFYLVSPQTPVIRPKDDQNTHNPLNSPKVNGFPQQRSDGWMEVQISEFKSLTTTKPIPMHLHLTRCDRKKCSELIIEGIEFRPI